MSLFYQIGIYVISILGTFILDQHFALYVPKYAL